MGEWLTGARDRLAGAVGDDASQYELDEKAVEAILELARVAAHESGARTNAPLACYLVGLAHGRHPGKTLPDLVGETSGS